MGLSIRAKAWADRQARERLAKREAELAAAVGQAETFHREFLDRHRAAALLGIAPRTLKAWTMKPGWMPAGIKRGTCRQSRVTWKRSELLEFAADPAGWRARAAAKG